MASWNWKIYFPLTLLFCSSSCFEQIKPNGSATVSPHGSVYDEEEDPDESPVDEECGTLLTPLNVRLSEHTGSCISCHNPSGSAASTRFKPDQLGNRQSQPLSELGNLIYKKASNEVNHGGGRIWDPGDATYNAVKSIVSESSQIKRQCVEKSQNNGRTQIVELSLMSSPRLKRRIEIATGNIEGALSPPPVPSDLSTEKKLLRL